jgi:ubiquinone/menaquinone biosynthesis C-methylase UbiE
LNDAVGRAAANFVTEKFPALKPRRVLDLGCGVGHATLPFVDAYPEAELFGVDLGAPTLRYAHARAESLGAKVAFSQQNAASTDFEDGAFDLVVSCLLLHEVPQKVTSGIIAECHRLLAPGGVMMHADSFARRDEPFAAFLGHRHEVENHEPFITGGLTIDWEKACVDAGFARDDVFKVLHQPVHNRIPLHMRGAVKS